MQAQYTPKAALNEAAQPLSTPTTRLDSIDQFRGFATLAMVLGNTIIGVAYLPSWLKHTPDIGLTIIDLGAPWFIFAISLTVGLSAQRRIKKNGWSGMFSHGFTRSMALVGIGAIFGACRIAFGMNPGGIDWGVLQAIGVANLLTLLVIAFPAGIRLVVGLLLLGGYQLLLDHFWLETVLISPHGGIHGVFAWTAMMILGTVLADLYHEGGNRRTLVPWLGLALVAAGIALSVWVPVSKTRVSASYVLVSLGCSTLLFVFFGVMTDRMRLRSSLLVACGKNPLLLYLIHQVMLGLLVLPNMPGWYSEAPIPLMLAQLAVQMTAIAWIGHTLDKHKIYFTL